MKQFITVTARASSMLISPSPSVSKFATQYALKVSSSNSTSSRGSRATLKAAMLRLTLRSIWILAEVDLTFLPLFPPDVPSMVILKPLVKVTGGITKLNSVASSAELPRVTGVGQFILILDVAPFPIVTVGRPPMA